MRRLVLWVILGLLLSAGTPSAATGTRILLVARDLDGHLLSGFRFAYAGVASQPTSKAGATELDLPSDHQTGQQITIELLAGPNEAEEWFLVAPQLNIPSASAPAAVVLMRRSTLRQIAAAARDAPRPASLRPGELTAEDRKRALVEAAAQHGLTPTQLETAIGSFAETQDSKDRGIAAYLEGQYSQAEELLDKAVEREEADLVETLRYRGAAQYEQAKYRAAAASFRQALAMRGDDAVLMSRLAMSLRELAEWTEAEPLMRRTLDIVEKSFGPQHPKVSAALNSLALLLEDTNRLAEAEPLLRRSLAIDERSPGSQTPEVAADLNNLAALLVATNRLAEAEPLMRRALAIDEKSFGLQDPRLAAPLANLASLLLATNRAAEAEPLLRRALAIDEKSFGPQHPKVAGDLSNLAPLLLVTNRAAEAEPLLRQALAIDEKSFGLQHPAVARDLNNLALLLRDTNRLTEAEPLLRRALAIDEKSLGPQHPTVARDLNNLALLLQDTNRLVEAEPPLRQGLAIDEKSLGPQHPTVALDLSSLAQLLMQTNRLAEAEPLMRRALAIDEQGFGPQRPERAVYLYNLALLLQTTNRLAEAEPLMRRALAIFLALRHRTGHDHPAQSTVASDYRQLLKEMGNSEAEIDATIAALARSPE
jgi:tetratricopeptide (TPR) repeat protein